MNLRKIKKETIKKIFISLFIILCIGGVWWYFFGNPLVVLVLLFKKATWKALWMFLKKKIFSQLVAWWFSLTATKAIFLIVQRLIIDNIVSKFLSDNVFKPIGPSIKRLWQSLGKKMKFFGLAIVGFMPPVVLAVVQVISGGITGLAGWGIIKAIVITFGKLIGSILLYLIGSLDKLVHLPFIGPIVEIIAFSIGWTWLEKKFPGLKRLFDPIVKVARIIMKQISRLYYLGTNRGSKRVKGGSKWLADKIDRLAGYDPEEIRLREKKQQMLQKLVEILEKKKQKQQQKEYPSARITKFRHKDKQNLSTKYDQK